MPTPRQWQLHNHLASAEKLVFLSDVNGVRRDKNNPDTIIHTLSSGEAKQLIDEGVIDAGMIPRSKHASKLWVEGSARFISLMVE